MVFSEKLKRLMGTGRYSQSELAKLLDVSQNLISLWTRGKSVPDMREVLKLSRLFAVPLEWLSDDELDEPPPGLSEAEQTALDTVRELGLTKGDVIRLLSGRGLLGRPGSRPVEMGPGSEV